MFRGEDYQSEDHIRGKDYRRGEKTTFEVVLPIFGPSLE